jgi:hypothetical protein
MDEKRQSLSLQKFILLVLLSDEAREHWRRQQLSAFVYLNHFRQVNASTRASLSRALRGLEEHGFIIRVRGRWQLNQTIGEPGFIDALLLYCDVASGKQPNVYRDFTGLHFKTLHKELDEVGTKRAAAKAPRFRKNPEQ